MPQSAKLTVLLFLLTAWAVSAVSRSGDKSIRARQTLRVHIPGEIRIVPTNYDDSGQPQSLRISSGTGIAVRLETQSDSHVTQTAVCMVQEGRSVTIPVTQTTDSDGRNHVSVITILPGW